MFGFNFYSELRREAFRRWQEMSDEIVRGWLGSPLFLQTNAFWTNQTLDVYDFWLNYWTAVGVDRETLHDAFRKFVGLSQVGSKLYSKNIKTAQAAGILPKTAQTPCEIILENHHFRLLYYKSSAKTKKTPILIVSSLVGKYYILDLTPGRSYVSYLLENGFDVFLVDWTTDEASEQLDLEDYACRFLKAIVEQACEVSGSENLSLLGYSMGGLLALIYTALHGEKVKNLLLLTTPVDFETAHVIKDWTSEKYFDVDRVLDFWGNVPSETVSWSLQMVKPVSSLARGANLLQYRGGSEDFAALLALEIWLHDAAPLPGKLFRTLIKQLYRKNLLVKNKLKIGARTVDLTNVKCPVLNVVGTHDQVAVPESSLKLLDLLGSSDKRTLALDYGHLTIAVGSGAKEDFWRESVAWLGARSRS